MTVYPDTREVLSALIDGHEFAGRLATTYFQLQTDYQSVAQDGAAVLIYTTGGTEGHIDRVDRATIEVYAPGTDAVAVSEAIRAAIVESDHDTAAGYVDDVRCEVTPHDVPFPSELVNQARATYLVTARPA